MEQVWRVSEVSAYYMFVTFTNVQVSVSPEKNI